MDLKHGKGKFFWPNGDIYSGGWVRGKKHGQGMIFSLSKNLQIKGQWKRGVKLKGNI